MTYLQLLLKLTGEIEIPSYMKHGKMIYVRDLRVT